MPHPPPSETFWCDAAQTAVYLINCLPAPNLQNRSFFFFLRCSLRNLLPILHFEILDVYALSAFLHMNIQSLGPNLINVFLLGTEMSINDFFVMTLLLDRLELAVKSSSLKASTTMHVITFSKIFYISYLPAFPHQPSHEPPDRFSIHMYTLRQIFFPYTPVYS